MSEPAPGATLLRVIPAAFYLIIPLLFGPLMLLGGLLVTLEVPLSRGPGIVARPGGSQLWSQMTAVVKKCGGPDISVGVDEIGDPKR
jgi:hypothetical protein